MSSPIENQLLEQACPQIKRPYCVGLNIGCGNRSIGGSIGVDYREDAAAAHIVADARQLPIRSRSLDYIVSCHCLEHLRDGPLSVLREWVRCLKIGSPLALCVPDGSDGENALRYQVPPGKHIDGQHVHLFTPDNLRTYMVVAGLEDVETSVHDRMPYWRTKIILGKGIRSASYQENPYRWRAWTWAKEVLRDLPIMSGTRVRYKDWREQSIAKKLFHL